jgi:alpha-D-ribose 1-methylphosphonate 5-triphosphate synthase subunit PhnH
MNQPVNVLAPGLADPGHDAQRLFRAVLDAFAHPGRITSLPDPPAGPGVVSPATAAYLLTLVDRDTPLWLPVLGAGTARRWRGPGIAGESAVAVGGLGADFWQAWACNHALFPCGVDIVFTAGSQLLALPRSIAVEG